MRLTFRSTRSGARKRLEPSRTAGEAPANVHVNRFFNETKAFGVPRQSSIPKGLSPPTKARKRESNIVTETLTSSNHSFVSQSVLCHSATSSYSTRYEESGRRSQPGNDSSSSYPTPEAVSSAEDSPIPNSSISSSGNSSAGLDTQTELNETFSRVKTEPHNDDGVVTNEVPEMEMESVFFDRDEEPCSGWEDEPLSCKTEPVDARGDADLPDEWEDDEQCCFSPSAPVFNPASEEPESNPQSDDDDENENFHHLPATRVTEVTLNCEFANTRKESIINRVTVEDHRHAAVFWSNRANSQCPETLPEHEDSACECSGDETDSSRHWFHTLRKDPTNISTESSAATDLSAEKNDELTLIDRNEECDEVFVEDECADVENEVRVEGEAGGELVNANPNQPNLNDDGAAVNDIPQEAMETQSENPPVTTISEDSAPSRPQNHDYPSVVRAVWKTTCQEKSSGSSSRDSHQRRRICSDSHQSLSKSKDQHNRSVGDEPNAQRKVHGAVKPHPRLVTSQRTEFLNSKIEKRRRSPTRHRQKSPARSSRSLRRQSPQTSDQRPPKSNWHLNPRMLPQRMKAQSNFQNSLDELRTWFSEVSGPKENIGSAQPVNSGTNEPINVVISPPAESQPLNNNSLKQLNKEAEDSRQRKLPANTTAVADMIHNNSNVPIPSPPISAASSVVSMNSDLPTPEPQSTSPADLSQSKENLCDESRLIEYVGKTDCFYYDYQRLHSRLSSVVKDRLFNQVQQSEKTQMIILRVSVADRDSRDQLGFGTSLGFALSPRMDLPPHQSRQAYIVFYPPTKATEEQKKQLKERLGNTGQQGDVMFFHEMIELVSRLKMSCLVAADGEDRKYAQNASLGECGHFVVP